MAVGAAGGSGVGTVVAAALSGATVGGRPVGVLRTTAPIGVAVTEVDGGGVKVEPVATVPIGRGVRVN